MIPESKWVLVDRPGWFGERRDELIASYNEKHGEGNWKIGHILGPRVLDFPEAVKIYELCYERHFLNPVTRYLWLALFRGASEVWTELESDIDSGMDYSIQKAPANHYEDVAIRRIMDKYGFSFKGSKPIRIRADSDDPIGVGLCSLRVEFIFPEYIEAPLPGIHWWDRIKGMLEPWWHLNKGLYVLREVLE